MTRLLVVSYDVSDLSDEEIDFLAGEALAQAERSEGHPSVPAASRFAESATALDPQREV